MVAMGARPLFVGSLSLIVAGRIIDILVPGALGRWSRSHGGKSESVDGPLQLLDAPKN
jgi:hypothetical protein